MPHRSRKCHKRNSANRRALGSELLEKRVLLTADLIINELLAINNSVLLDEDGESSDWVEIRNQGDEAIDLAGYYLSDNGVDLIKWQFPSTVLDANEQLVVFASGKDRVDPAATLHTNFQLSGSGELLTLTEPDGTTIADSMNYPAQLSDVTYGVGSTHETTRLIGSDAAVTYYLIPSADDAALGETWTDANFDDTAWHSGFGGLGFFADTTPPNGGLEGTVALQTPTGASGNQALGVPIGMDFVVNEPIMVTALGAFDDVSNSTDPSTSGFRSAISIDLWARDDNGTPNDFSDDSGSQLIASEIFAGTAGVQIGGSRYVALEKPIGLKPGGYTISARGYSAAERNAVALAGEGYGQVADSEAVSFVGSSRLGSPGDMYPSFADSGNAHRYGAGSFLFIDPEPQLPPAADEGPYVAYDTQPGAGNAFTNDNLGMDFNVQRPIQVTELGVFDSNQDGIQGTLAVSVYSRDTGEQLATLDFRPDNQGELKAGTGSRFMALDEPLELPAGQYSIVSSGYLGEDPFSRFGVNNAIHSDLNNGGGAISFTGTSRVTFGTNRFAEEAHHRLPSLTDIGPIDRWAAGTFKFENVADAIVSTDISNEMFLTNASAYLRTPFNVKDASRFDALTLNVNYDDGFVVYLNGTEIAAVNAPDTRAWDSTATLARTGNEIFTTQSIDLSANLNRLTEGTNLLAIQGLNISADDADFVIFATLDASSITGTQLGYLAAPTPGAPKTTTAAVGIAEQPSFSADGGFFDAATVVEMATETPDARILYTLDGSRPNEVNGIEYTGSMTIDSTTTLRAITIKTDFISSPVTTATYLFVDDVVNVTGVPTGYSNHWNGEPVDYSISQSADDLPLIAGDPTLSVAEAQDVIKESLRSLPTMSIVIEPELLFGLGRGIYTNPYPRGRNSESAASVEYYLEDGSLAYQIDAGLRMMGWTSRIPQVSPKHSLRLLFREEYGAARLNYPMFENSPVGSFDTLALRSNSRDTWISDYPFGPDPPYGAMRGIASYIRDEWSKSTLQDLGQVAPDGNFVHLYLNGIYWGVYNPTERPDGAFAADRFGGTEDDYDSVLFCNPTARASHGDLVAWNAMIAIADAGLASDAAYQMLQGNNPDGTRNPDFERYLDVENLIDFMIAGQYDATDDWPCNFYAIRSREPGADGFQWITWDNDLAFPNGDVNAERIDANLTGTPKSSPWRLHSVLAQNDEYLLEFADHAHKHLFNDGALTPAAAVQRWQNIAAEVAPGLIAESARWGDYRRDVGFAGPAELYTKSHWDAFMQVMVDQYFPNRSGILLDQYRNKGFYPAVDAPVFNQPGGQIDAGFALDMSAPGGDTIYYTIDGSDPRESVTNVQLLSDLDEKRIFFTTDAATGIALGTQWRDPNYDDSGWFQGFGTVGYEADPNGDYFDFLTISTGIMFNANSSIYLRSSFEFDDATKGDIEKLSLKMRRDDGFVAFLNGVEVARANAPSVLAWNSQAPAANPDSAALNYENFDLTPFIDQLVDGTNVLAIHGLNAGSNSSDFMLSTELIASTSAGEVSATSSEYTGPIQLEGSTSVKARAFDGATWSALNESQFILNSPVRVSEINYNPVGDDESTEFVELINTSDTAVNLAGYYFSDGIVYQFPTDNPRMLEPGAYIVVSADSATLLAANPGLDLTLIAPGVFSGRLSNGGETIAINDANGGLVQEFTYDDAWYSPTDGDGFSLNIIDVNADKDTWNNADAWRAGTVQGGTPGIADPGITVMAGVVAADKEHRRAPQAALAPISIDTFDESSTSPVVPETHHSPDTDPSDDPFQLVGIVPLGMVDDEESVPVNRGEYDNAIVLREYDLALAAPAEFASESDSAIDSTLEGSPTGGDDDWSLTVDEALGQLTSRDVRRQSFGKRR